jgi:magnesium-transporting ATPase (P-type)
VGVAMGLVGTDVAKEAADIILTDDNFGSIVAAIEEGRAIYENIRKFVTYIFSSNVPEVLPFLFTSALGVPPALSVRQILAIDMGTDILPAIALGTEKPEPGIMQRPPRRQTARLIDRGLLTRSFLWLGLLETLLCYLGYLAIYLFSGNAGMLNIGFLNTIDWPILFPSIQDVQLTARTVYFAGVVFAQIGNVFACRATTAHNTQMGWGSNKTLLVGVVVALFILSLLVFVPELSLSFDNQVFPPILWLFLFLYSPLIYGLDWLRKRITEYTIRKRDVPRHAG